MKLINKIVNTLKTFNEKKEKTLSPLEMLNIEYEAAKKQYVIAQNHVEFADTDYIEIATLELMAAKKKLNRLSLEVKKLTGVTPKTNGEDIMLNWCLEAE